jgi:hypothetical protein
MEQTHRGDGGMTATPRTVNLWNAGTFRGEQPGRLQAVLLPAALVKVTIILPTTTRRADMT